MLLFLLRRIGLMLLTALCLTFVVFYLTNLPAKLETLAKTQAGSRMTDAEVQNWIERNGYGSPVLVRYGEWLGVVPGWVREAPDGTVTGRCVRLNDDDVARAGERCGLLQGEWGQSTRFSADVLQVINDRLSATGLLMLWVLIVMVPSALILGILAGMREGSRTNMCPGWCSSRFWRPRPSGCRRCWPAWGFLRGGCCSRATRVRHWMTLPSGISRCR